MVKLIPKGGGEYGVIGLVEVLWKAVMVILNLLLSTSISFHDMLHIFQEGLGTGTASSEAKMIQQLTTMR